MNKRGFFVSIVVFLFLIEEAFAYVSLRGATYTAVNILDEVARFICVLLGVPCYSFHTFLVGFLIPVLLVYAMFFGILTSLKPFSGSTWETKMYSTISLLLAAMMFLVANKYTRIFEWLITNGTGIVAVILYAGLFFLMIAWGFYHFYAGGAGFYKAGFQDFRQYNNAIQRYKRAVTEYDKITNEIEKINDEIIREQLKRTPDLNRIQQLTTTLNTKKTHQLTLKAAIDGWEESTNKLKAQIIKGVTSG